MNVLTITGDRNIFLAGTDACRRFAMQQEAVEQFTPVFWGRGALTQAFHMLGAWDVVTAQDPFWRGLVAWVVARRAGARLNIQVHADLSGQSLFKQTLAEFVLRRADSVRVVSERIHVQVQKMKVRAHIVVLPVFVDISRFRNLAHEPQKQKTILWVGRFEEEKDPLAAIDVLQKVHGKDIHAKLIMLGKGSLEPQLRARAEGLLVELPGWQDPLPYLARADVVLCTSLHESWGASIVEALAASVAVVAPDVGVAREAGACVVPRAQLGDEVARVLQRGERGALRLELLDAKAWSAAWRNSL